MTSFLSMVPVHVLFSGRHGMPTPNNLNNPEALHVTVMRLFGALEGESPRAGAGVLFRLEPAGPGHPAALLIRSAVAPEAQVEGLTVRKDQQTPPEGTPVAFRLSANAVRRRKDGSVRPVPRDDAPQEGFDGMTEWVSAKLEGALSGVELLNHDRNVIGAKTRRALQIDLVDGFGIVEDTGKLTDLLTGGVGRAKNYGCGMLTVKAVA